MEKQKNTTVEQNDPIFKLSGTLTRTIAMKAAMETLYRNLPSVPILERKRRSEVREILDCLADDIEDARSRSENALGIVRLHDEKLDDIADSIRYLKSEIDSMKLR